MIFSNLLLTYAGGLNLGITSETTKRIINIKNKIFAIPAAVPAIPENPKIAASIAITKNVTAQFNISYTLLKFSWVDSKYKCQTYKKILVT
jgi:uncharacterized membrane protein YjjB (DUF3815 family)